MTEVIVLSGWAGGLLVGLYALLQLALFGSPLGVSTGYGNVCALTSRKPFFRSGPLRPEEQLAAMVSRSGCPWGACSPR